VLIVRCHECPHSASVTQRAERYRSIVPAIEPHFEDLPPKPRSNTVCLGSYHTSSLLSNPGGVKIEGAFTRSPKTTTPVQGSFRSSFRNCEGNWRYAVLPGSRFGRTSLLAVAYGSDTWICAGVSREPSLLGACAEALERLKARNHPAEFSKEISR